MTLLVGTSTVAAFVAGVAALFAPCCITVLLPSYLGSIFRERRTVFLMTFLFFLGILTVFLPLGLGSALFSQFLSRYHNAIFAAGGLFLLGLGVTMVLGVHWSLPWRVTPALARHNAFSVYTLGIFSGIATTCCAPVLAGVLALSVLPGSVWLGGAYTLAYVLGMVAPLFGLALLLDRTKATQRLMQARRPLTYRLGPRRVSVSLPDLISGILFIGMGTLTAWLAFGNKLAMQSTSQLTVNLWATKLTRALQGVTALLPEAWWAVLFALLLLGLTIRFLHLLRKESTHAQPK